MTFAELLAAGTKVFSFAGHMLGLKEIFDWVKDLGSKVGNIPGMPSAPKGTVEERAFYSLLKKVSDTDMQKAIMAWLIFVFLPPPNTGALGRMEFNRAKQDFFCFVLNIGDDAAQLDFLTTLAGRLSGVTPENYEEVYRQVEREYRVLGVPLPPEIHFDEKVSEQYKAMLRRKKKRSLAYKFVNKRL